MTEPYKIIEVKESVFADNDREAARLRTQLKQDRTFLLNLMSSPGSGKTTTLLRTLEALKDELRIGVMEQTSTPTWTRRLSRTRASRPSSSTRAACATSMQA